MENRSPVTAAPEQVEGHSSVNLGYNPTDSHNNNQNLDDESGGSKGSTIHIPDSVFQPGRSFNISYSPVNAHNGNINKGKRSGNSAGNKVEVYVNQRSDIKTEDFTEMGQTIGASVGGESSADDNFKNLKSPNFISLVKNGGKNGRVPRVPRTKPSD